MSINISNFHAGVPSMPSSTKPSWFVIKDSDNLITQLFKVVVQFFSSYKSLNKNLPHLHEKNIYWLRADQVRSLDLHVFSKNTRPTQIEHLTKHQSKNLSFQQRNTIQNIQGRRAPSTNHTPKPPASPAPSSSRPDSSVQTEIDRILAMYIDEESRAALLNSVLNASSSVLPSPSEGSLESKEKVEVEKGKALAAKARHRIEDPSLDILGEARAINTAAVEGLFREMLTFAHTHCDSLGYPQGKSNTIHAQAFGSNPPSYFANAHNGHGSFNTFQSSLFGLANLVRFGPQILHDLRENLFHGCEREYSEGKGLKLMRSKTGNTVDLDTVVPLEVVRTGTARIQEYAADTIQGFNNLFHNFKTSRLDPNQFSPGEIANSRHLFTKRESSLQIHSHIHQARGNHDKGSYGIWSYTRPNTFQTSYHVNVPALHDVVNTLLESPYLLADTWLSIKEKFSSNPIQLEQEQLSLLHYLLNGGNYLGEGTDSESKFLKCFNEKLETCEKVHQKWCAPKQLSHKEKAIAEFGSKAVSQSLGKDKIKERIYPGILESIKAYSFQDLITENAPKGFDERTSREEINALVSQPEAFAQAWRYTTSLGINEQTLCQVDENSHYHPFSKDTLKLFLTDYIYYDIVTAIED
jgi:hypothetical protein